MVLGPLAARPPARSRCSACQPRQAIARGLVVRGDADRRACSRTSPSARPSQYTASLFADTQPVDEVLAHAGITGIADRKVGKCSGGEQQRLRFAMALLSDPALLLLDEPTTGMDVEGRRAFWSAIREDAEQGRTVLFATHYLEEADQYADRIVLISNGPDRRRRHRHARSRRWPPAAPSAPPSPAPTTQALAALGGVERVEVRGDTVYVHAKDTDAVARYLLTETDARDLEITARGLEDAFLSLTGDDADDRRPTHDRTPRRSPPMTTHHRPDHPPGAAARRLQPHRARHRAQADAAQPAHDHLHAGLPGRAVLRVRLGQPAGSEKVGARQRRGLHHGLDGAVRRRADRRLRRARWSPSSGPSAGRASCG